MRIKALAVLISITFIFPIVAAHGANEFAFIMRSKSIQPNGTEVLQNDSLVFYNVVSYNRTILVDSTKDGQHDLQCITLSSNSSSIKDECEFWLNPDEWSPGNYQFDIYSNGSIWQSIEVKVILDEHEETGPPRDYSFNLGNEVVEEEKEEITTEKYLFYMAAFSASAGLIISARRFTDE